MKTEPIRILVPLERGESAREPARLLEALFAPAAIQVRALHVGRVAVPVFYFPTGVEALGSLRRDQLAWEESARKVLTRQIRPLEEAGFTVQVEVTAGSVLGEVLKRAELWRADLVLARPQREGARSRGLGGVAAGLIHAASAPVLLYRRISADYRIRSVLAPVDFSSFSRKAIRWSLLVASLTRASLRLLHVLPETSARWAPGLRRIALEMVREERQRAERQLREFGGSAIPVEAVIIERKDPARGILETQKQGVDLVVLGASGKTGLASVLGSVTRRVARDCPCPVLVIPTSSRVSAVEVWRKGRR